DLDLVAHVAHAVAGHGDVLGSMLHAPLRHAAGKRGDAGLHLHGDAAGVQVVRVGELLVDLLGDALVGAHVVARPHAAIAAAHRFAARIGGVEAVGTEAVSLLH